MRSMKAIGGLTHGRGVEEGVRNLWALSLSCSAEVHNALMELTGASLHTSEQHVELRESRRAADFKYCNAFLNWLETRNPFQIQSPDLYSLSTGISSIEGKDYVNCETAEEIGVSI